MWLEGNPAAEDWDKRHTIGQRRRCFQLFRATPTDSAVDSGAPSRMARSSTVHSQWFQCHGFPLLDPFFTLVFQIRPSFFWQELQQKPKLF